MPSVPPFDLSTLDAAYVLQVQFQLHATGADYGYLASWARTGLSVTKIFYSLDLIIACARVLQHVIADYLSPEDVPKMPLTFASLSQDVQQAVIDVHTKLGTVMRQCELLPLSGRKLTSACGQVAALCCPSKYSSAFQHV